jgi:hypothetical protein
LETSVYFLHNSLSKCYCGEELSYIYLVCCTQSLYRRNLGNTLGTSIQYLSEFESWNIICGCASIIMFHNTTESIIYNKYSVCAEGKFIIFV